MGRTITVDPAKLTTAAGLMDEQAGEYKKQYGLLFAEVDGMGANWQGADNLAYVTQIKGFMDDFDKMVALMGQYSQFLKDSAILYKATQDDVITQAKKLTN